MIRSAGSHDKRDEGPQSASTANFPGLAVMIRDQVWLLVEWQRKSDNESDGCSSGAREDLLYPLAAGSRTGDPLWGIRAGLGI
jgi:hypothetical protein